MTTPTPAQAFAELFSELEFYLDTLKGLEPTPRWLRVIPEPLGTLYGSLLRLNYRLEEIGGDTEDAHPQVFPGAERVEKLLRLGQEHLPQSTTLLWSLRKVVEGAEGDVLDLIEEAAEYRPAATPAVPKTPQEKLLAHVEYVLYAGAIQAAESFTRVTQAEEILSLLYLRHCLFSEPLPLDEVANELERLWATLVRKHRKVPPAGSKFQVLVEQHACIWYPEADPLSGRFWKSALAT